MLKSLSAIFIWFIAIFFFILSNEFTFANQDVKDKTFNLTEIFVDSNPVLKSPKSLEEIISDIVDFIVIIIWALGILWIIVWGFMVMVSGSSDLAKQWKMTILYSILWIFFTLWSYALIKLVQILVFSFW